MALIPLDWCVPTMWCHLPSLTLLVENTDWSVPTPGLPPSKKIARLSEARPADLLTHRKYPFSYPAWCFPMGMEESVVSPAFILIQIENEQFVSANPSTLPKST